MSPEKSLLAAKALAIPTKRKIVIQFASDVEYTCVVKNMIYVSDYLETRLKILRTDFAARLGVFIIPGNLILNLQVVPSICAEKSPYLEKHYFPYFSQGNTIELWQMIKFVFHRKRVLTLKAKVEYKHLVQKTSGFRLYKKVRNTGIHTYHVYCALDESKYTLMSNTPNCKVLTNIIGIFGYTILNCTLYNWWWNDSIDDRY